MADKSPGPLDQTQKPVVVKDGTSPQAAAPKAGPTGAAAPSPTPTVLKIEITAPKPATIFSITAEPKMPVIEAIATIVGATTDPTATTSFEWTARIVFDSGKCPSGKKTGGGTRTTASPDVTKAVVGGKFTPEFTQIRGGDLTLSVKATVGNQVLEAKTDGLKIQGTNPSTSVVVAALSDDTHRKIACQESTMKQFLAAPEEAGAIYPYFSGDKLLGVGICQLTRPAPTDDEIWSWKANIEAGEKLYKEKKGTAKSYPRDVRNSAKFQALVKKYTDGLKAPAKAPEPAAKAPDPAAKAPAPGDKVPDPAAKAPAPAPKVPVQVTVKVPDYTAEELEDDTIRGFNGYAGADGFGNPLHEFRIQVDKDGALVVDGDPTTGTVNAKWERVPAADRGTSGDPSYVSNVKKRSPQCK